MRVLIVLFMVIAACGLLTVSAESSDVQTDTTPAAADSTATDPATDKETDDKLDDEDKDEKDDDVAEDDADDLPEMDDDDDDEDEDDLDDDDIWTIKPKLYSYYEKQFKTMEPNLNGFITGSVAKPFFERSKLPLNELSKIWELSDVTKDGALSFAEFCTAMHLVVLRVRNFELPNELPEKLQPYAPLIDFNTDTTNNPINRNKTNEESIDIQIVHPVALRYNTNNQNHYQQNQASGSIPEPPPRHSRSSSLGTINNPQAPPNSGTANHQQPSTTSNQPVQVNSTVSNVPNNPSSVTIPNTVNTPKILQQQPVVPPRITSPPPVYHQPQTQNEHSQQQQQQQAHSSALLPPPPPPLPHHQLHHHQNRLHHHQQHYPINQQFSNPLPTANTRAPPLPPANQSSDDITKNIEKLVDQMSALNVERLKKISESNQKQQAVAASSSTSSTNSIDVDALAFSIKTQTEQNQLLRRVFSELEKELRALTDNRIALEIKLDYLNTATQSTNPSIVTTGASLTATASSNASNSTKKQQATIPSTPIAPNSSAQQNVQSSNLSSSNANSNNLPISSNIQPTSSNSGLTPSTTKTVIHTKANI